jgi:SAM-dependent methyltransferase/uncharacterized protein YbaR (Trm112 family)
MYKRLLDFLRCPDCGEPLDLEALAAGGPDGDEISEGLLHCPGEHWFPIVGGIPRMLPDAIQEHWHHLKTVIDHEMSDAVRGLVARIRDSAEGEYDRRTRDNFSSEWEHHQLGDKTWGMELDDRVEWFFLDPIRIPRAELEGKIVLDAGCGNGSQSVAYTQFGTEVIAVDISSGLELGYAFRHRHAGARPDRVHFVQADLQRPPFARASVDIIHSSGVLQATPNTERTFRGLCPLLKPGGTFYVWVLKREPVVTPIVNGIRTVTTRVPTPIFAKVAHLLAPAFIAFCWVLNKLGIRKYPPFSRREATIALLDIFGAPYAHYHSYPEVARWYRSEGFDDVWPCNDDRRGFGACGRKSGGVSHQQLRQADGVVGAT